MKSQAYFEKIHKHIENNLKTANSSIRLAVAWFTDKRLFNILCDKAKEGVRVELLMANHDINFDSDINYRNLIDNGGEVFWIGKEGMYAPLMHNKFCIIDNNILIFGSYNWTEKAKSNHESITIIEEDDNLILDFNQEFDKIKNKYYSTETVIDWTKIVIRLDTLLNVIKLEDVEDINYQLEKTKSLIPKTSVEERIVELKKIIDFIAIKKYSEAVILIQKFTSDFKKISIYSDPEIPALQLEIRSLEFQITSLEDEKTDIEKNIRGFELRYNKELGKIIKQILFYKQLVAKKVLDNNPEDNLYKEIYDEMKSDYEEFSKSHEETIKQKSPIELNEEEQTLLKQTYRKASKLCHPDKVTEEQKELAAQVFTDLKIAYEQNDLKKVNEILANLEKGIFKSQGETVTKKDNLKIIRENLLRKRNELEELLQVIKKSDVFSKICNIMDLDDYFLTTKNELTKRMEELKNSAS